MISSTQSAVNIETPQLELNIAGVTDLTELTNKINCICDQAEDSHAVIVLRLTSSSFDLMNKPHQMCIQNVNRWERCVRRLERLPAAVIAMISGTTSGPALELLLAADYRIATTNVQLSMTNNNGSIWPGMLIHRLVNQIGVTRSRQFLIGSHKMTAQQAIEIGLLDELSNTEQAVQAAASRLGLMPGTEWAICRQLISDATTMTFEDALGAHLAACDRELRRLYGWQQKNPRRTK